MSSRKKSDIAGARRNGSDTVEVDHMTARSDDDALVNQFVGIDLSDADARKAVEAVIGDGNARFGSGDYGVLTAVGETDSNGYPLTCTVTLRDEHAASVPNVPYAALSRAQAGRR